MENKLESVESIKAFIHDMSICLENMTEAVHVIENTKDTIEKIMKKQ